MTEYGTSKWDRRETGAGQRATDQQATQTPTEPQIEAKVPVPSTRLSSAELLGELQHESWKK